MVRGIKKGKGERWRWLSIHDDEDEWKNEWIVCERVGIWKKKGRSVSLDGIPDLHCNGSKSFLACLSVGGKGYCVV